MARVTLLAKLKESIQGKRGLDCPNEGPGALKDLGRYRSECF